MNSVFSSSPTTNSSPHSTISTHSLSSHSNSISSLQSISSPSSPIGSITRCEGLDLLVRAVYYVAGSMVGVPYIQRRVIRRGRRRRTFEFNRVTESEIFGDEKEGEKKNDTAVGEKLKGKKRQRREMALPLKYQDSVLQSWKRQSRCQP